MDIGGEGVGVYAEAKGEYTRQLCQFLVPALQKFFLDLLDEAKEKEPEARKLLLTFQGLLEAIAEWNADKVQRETGALNTSTQCDYLEELLTAVFIAHTKVLSAIRLTSRQKKLQITIPKLEHFLHRTMTECARILWSNTYLFAPSGTSIERQKNMRQIEAHIQDGVHQAIRGMLPVKSILKEYLKDEPGEEEEEGDEEEIPSSKKGGDEETKAEELEADTTVSDAPAAVDISGVITIAALDISGATPAAEPVAEPVTTPVDASVTAQPAPQTIIVDSAPQVTFTGMDSVFDSENPDQSTFKPMNDGREEEIVEDIQILDTPPEAMDDFEDLDNPDNSKPATAAPSTGILDESMPMDFEEITEDE
jgi:hypothetical protein